MHTSRGGGWNRTFCGIAKGEMDHVEGCWAAEDEALEVGFLESFDDTFWEFAKGKYTSLANKGFSRSLMKGKPRKGRQGKDPKERSPFQT